MDEKTDYHVETTEIKNKIPIISGLGTTAPLVAVENKTPDFSNLVKETDYDAKISDIESKYSNTADYNKFTSQTIAAKIKQKGLVAKYTAWNKQVARLATKGELKVEKVKVSYKKVQVFY